MMTSAAETPSSSWMPVGMPRPSSVTVQEPSALSVTVTSVGEAGERFVDRVVDDLVDHVVQARAVVGVADIHAGALAHRVEAAQHLDRIGAVVVAALVGRSFVDVERRLRFVRQFRGLHFGWSVAWRTGPSAAIRVGFQYTPERPRNARFSRAARRLAPGGGAPGRRANFPLDRRAAGNRQCAAAAR